MEEKTDTDQKLKSLHSGFEHTSNLVDRVAAPLIMKNKAYLEKRKNRPKPKPLTEKEESEIRDKAVRLWMGSHMSAKHSQFDIARVHPEVVQMFTNYMRNRRVLKYHFGVHGVNGVGKTTALHWIVWSMLLKRGEINLETRKVEYSNQSKWPVYYRLNDVVEKSEDRDFKFRCSRSWLHVIDEVNLQKIPEWRVEIIFRWVDDLEQRGKRVFWATNMTPAEMKSTVDTSRWSSGILRRLLCRDDMGENRTEFVHMESKKQQT